VSPAALLGAASEKSKSLEAAAQILAKEVVESAAWNDAWLANAVDCWAEHRFATEVWQADVRCVAKALGTLHGLEGPLDLQSVFTSEDGEMPALEQIEAPFFSVAKSDAIIQVLPSALRFWDKLGLSPRAGKKDVCAFVFFEELDEARVDVVDKWLQCVSSTYTVGGAVIRSRRSPDLFCRGITLGNMSGESRRVARRMALFLSSLSRSVRRWVSSSFGFSVSEIYFMFYDVSVLRDK